LRTSGFEYTWWSLKRIGISPDGGEPNCIGGIFAGVVGAVPPAGAAGAIDAIGVAVPADGDAMGVAAGAVDAMGDAEGVACAITLDPMLPGDDA
jgi:hypothetical protein